jgi:hypothetical protein
MLAAPHGITVFPEINNDPTLETLRRLVGRRVGQLFKIVIIRAVPDVHFCLKSLAIRATFPVTRVFLFMVRAAKRVVAMIPMAAVPGIRE